MSTATTGFDPIACVGFPESDGGLPFVLAGFQEEMGILVLGTTGRGPGVEGETEHLVTTPEHAREIFTTAQHHHNLLSVPFHVAVHFMERSFAAQVPAGWDVLIASLDEGVLNSARLIDPLRGYPDALDTRVRIEAILEEERGIAFGIQEAVVEQVFEDLMGVLTSQVLQSDNGRRIRLAKIIDRASDEALDASSRLRWIHSLQVVAWFGKQQGWDDVWKACWHTALAMEQGRMA